MISEELLTTVNEVYYQQKKSKEDVKKALLAKGWKEEDIKEEDIDKAITDIRNQALRKLPVISSIYKFFDSLETKYQHLSTKAVVIILVVAVFWLFLVAFAVYLIYDPISVIKSKPSDIPAPVINTPSSEGDGINFP